jgi:glutathione synthase
LKQVLSEGIKQPVAMGIHRSDYMIHHGEQIQQVELNTISSAFGALASRIAALHHYILHNWINLPSGMSLPQPNPTLQRLPNAFNVAVNEYRRTRGNLDGPVVVMMIVQPGERNSIDQRWLQHSVFENHNIRMIRRSLADVASRASLDSNAVLKIDGHEVAVAYFRAGYTPTDYPSQKEWAARLVIERSFAIKCPNIAYHLAGTKKIQQTLYDRTILKKYLPNPAEEERVFKCFTDQYSLDPGCNTDIINQAIKDSHVRFSKLASLQPWILPGFLLRRL